MISENYAKAYTEILEIIKFLPINEYSKIPKQKLDYYYANKDYEYNYQYDFDNPVYSRETAAIIVNLYKNYIVSNQEKEKIESILNLNSKILEKEKSEEFNSSNIFKNKARKVEIEESSGSMVKYRESILIKIRNWFKRTFK